MMFATVVRRSVPSARVGVRAFSVTPRAQKTVTEKVKDTAQDVSSLVLDLHMLVLNRFGMAARLT